MKKSKVLIPAMALLLFSTAASITGTVAWFTSSRTFTMQAGQFVVDNVDGGIKVDVEAGVGTQVDTTTKAVSTKSGYLFTHGSFDHSAKTAWTLNKESTGAGDYHAPKGPLESSTDPAVTGAEDNEDNWLGTTGIDGKKYYVAVSWKMTFTYEFHGETAPVGLYFNYGDSTIVVDANAQAQPASGHSEKTQYGFRIAFLPAGGSAKVWGNNNPHSSAAAFDKNAAYEVGQYAIYGNKTYKCKTAISASTGADWDDTKWDAVTAYEDLKYTTGAAKTAVTPYSASTYIPETSVYTAAEDGTESTQTANEARVERLGTISKITSGTGEGTGSIVVKCVAWFEGNDPNVISEAQMDKVTANMSFYVRSDYVAS